MKLKRLLILCVTTALLTLAFRIFLFAFYVVPSGSMVPTLLTGDYVIASKFAYGYGGVGSFDGWIHLPRRVGGHLPQRGDVVVFRSPGDDGPVVLVKRLIGLPGDIIQMVRGQLYINHTPVPRQLAPQVAAFPGDGEDTDDYVDYIEQLPNGPSHIMRLTRGEEDYELDNTPELTVPEHSYFFMGDNRDKSDDSRVSNVGMVPEENLIAKVDVIFFSYAEQSHVWNLADWPWALRWRRMFHAVN